MFADIKCQQCWISANWSQISIAFMACNFISNKCSTKLFYGSINECRGIAEVSSMPTNKYQLIEFNIAISVIRALITIKLFNRTNNVILVFI